jgi:hypothetical protein
MLFTVVVGNTVIVKDDAVPIQLFAVGVTVMVEITGVVPLLLATKVRISPLPLLPNPMEGSLFVQV